MRRPLIPKPTTDWPPVALVGLAGAVLAATVVRLWVMLSPIGRMEADEAVTGIMAQRILDGETYAFFAGQTYMGSLEQYAQAAVLAVLPDTPTTLRLVQVLLAAATCLLVGIAGRRLTGNPWLGVAAASMYALGPFFNIEKGIRSHGAYNMAQLLTVAGLLLVILLTDPRRRTPLTALAVGVVGGLALWESTLAVIALLPLLWWGIGLVRDRLRFLLPPAVLGAVIGAAPFIVHRIIHGPFPPSGTGVPPPTTFADRTDLLLSPVLGMFLGVRHIGDGRPVSQFVPPAIATMIALGALGAGVWSRRRQIGSLLALRGERASAIDPILLALALMVIPYGLTDYTWFAGTPRYLFVLYPFAILAAFVGVAHLTAKGRLAASIVLVAGTALLGVGAADRVLHEGGRGGFVAGARVHTEDLPEFADALRQRGVTAVRADYWLAYPLQFASEGGLAVDALTDDRFPDLEARVTAAGNVAYAVPAGEGADALGRSIRESGASARRLQVGRFVAFTDIHPPRTPAELGLP